MVVPANTLFITQIKKDAESTDEAMYHFYNARAHEGFELKNSGPTMVWIEEVS